MSRNMGRLLSRRYMLENLWTASNPAGTELMSRSLDTHISQSHDDNRQPLDLVDVVREAADDHWEIAHKQGITLRHADGPVTAFAPVDRELLARAIGNLLGNAIKFAPPGTQVTMGVRAEPGHWVLSVSDEGPSISTESQAEPFRPCFRDPSVHRVDGAGLGLLFVQTVMQGHGGRVAVHRQPGQGSRFELWLPIAEASS